MLQTKLKTDIFPNNGLTIELISLAFLLVSIYIDFLKYMTNRGYYKALGVPTFAQRKINVGSTWNKGIIVVVLAMIITVYSFPIKLGEPAVNIDNSEINKTVYLNWSQFFEYLTFCGAILALIIKLFFQTTNRLIILPGIQSATTCLVIALCILLLSLWSIDESFSQKLIEIVIIILLLLPAICFVIELYVYRFIFPFEAEYQITNIDGKTYLLMESVPEWTCLMEVEKDDQSETNRYIIVDRNEYLLVKQDKLKLQRVKGKIAYRK